MRALGRGWTLDRCNGFRAWLVPAVAFGIGCASAGPAASGGASSATPTSAPAPAATTAETPPATSTATTTADAPRRRYFTRLEVPSESEWRFLVLEERLVTLLAPETARAIPITQWKAEGRRVTLALVHGGQCEMTESAPSEPVILDCKDGPPSKLRELDPASDRQQIERIEKDRHALAPPADACERAERCCKAVWPILVPGQQCDLDFQLGPDRFLDTCVRALTGFKDFMVLKGKQPPPECR